MDSNEVLQIIQNGPSNKVELFASMQQLEFSMQTICGFLNGEGGLVIIGVDLANFNYGQHIIATDLEKITLAVDKIVPTASIEISTIPMLDGKYLIIIKTFQGDNAPYMYNEIAYDRTGCHTIMMTRKNYNKLLMRKNYAP